jgi:hypothetical protein
MDDNTQPRGPGRPRRAEETAQRRRRRSDEGLAPARKLEIPPDVAKRLEAEGRNPRWVNDEGNRMYRLTQLDDYDKVEGVEPVPVGVAPDGKPILAHLLSKPIEFIAEDRAKAEQRRAATEEALFTHPDAAEQAGKGRNPNPATAERYLDKSTNVRRGGNQILEG